MLEELFVRILGQNRVLWGLAGGLIIAALNTLGALLVLVWQNPSERSLDSALGFAAGVILSASFTSLILPGIEIGGVFPVGVGFGAGNLGDALALTLAIGIQNVPEGLAVSVAARNAGFESLFYAAIAGIRTGLVEIPLAVFGAFAVQVATPMLPYAMGFAAGGMLFVISDEIVPETHARGNERAATLGMMFGIVVMLVLDVLLG
ncbi:ZIP family metal transporter [Haladaptatus cibarius]|uniref:ZIP family metal transporter n=1 Tax=Haladaptatus cibarius TaxID=453847 RepID=UPI0006786281|nr:zinc permease [Haladaptatus cibarius]